jgi:hypothetical protein
MLIFIAELFGIFHSRLPKPLIIIVIGKRCDNFMGLVKKNGIVDRINKE